MKHTSALKGEYCTELRVVCAQNYTHRASVAGVT
jgi:hypothetical protein